MASNTPNYNLVKPTTNEYYDIAIANGNMDKIDAALKVNADAATASTITTGTAAAYTADLGAGYTLKKGVPFTIFPHVASAANPTLAAGGITAPMLQGSKAAKLEAGVPVRLVWDGGTSFFVLGGKALDPVTAAPRDVLAGRSYNDSDGEVQTGTLPSKVAATITPGTGNQIITAGQYLSGDQTILGDADLIPANIKSGVNIFGVTGQTSVVDTATEYSATADQIISGRSAWANGIPVVGTMPNRNAGHSKEILNDATSTAGRIYLKPEEGYWKDYCVYADDPNFIPANFKKGAKIFGLVGTFIGNIYTGNVPLQFIFYATGYYSRIFKVPAISNIPFTPSIIIFRGSNAGSQNGTCFCVQDTPFFRDIWGAGCLSYAAVSSTYKNLLRSDDGNTGGVDTPFNPIVTNGCLDFYLNIGNVSNDIVPVTLNFLAVKI